MKKSLSEKIYETVHKYKNQYDAGIKDSPSGDMHCDFVTEFANELIEIAKDHGELEMIRGYNKAKS